MQDLDNVFFYLVFKAVGKQIDKFFPIIDLQKSKLKKLIF